MRFELLRQRVERAESRVSACSNRAQASRLTFFDAWRRGWTPGRIVAAGLLSGFLVGRSQPLSRMDGARWLQMAGTVSSMFAALRAAAENASAAEAAEASAEAGNPAGAAPAAAPSPAPDALGTAAPAPSMARAPAPAEAATELSER